MSERTSYRLLSRFGNAEHEGEENPSIRDTDEVIKKGEVIKVAER